MLRVTICGWRTTVSASLHRFTVMRSTPSVLMKVRFPQPPLRESDDGARYYLLPPHAYGLGVTVETFRMPRNITGVAVGKSTYARAGLLVNTTPLEAGWTVCLSSRSPIWQISRFVFM